MITVYFEFVLCRSKGVIRCPLSAFVRPVYRIKSFGLPKVFCHISGGVQASARENRGLEAGAEKAEPS